MGFLRSAPTLHRVYTRRVPARRGCVMGMSPRSTCYECHTEDSTLIIMTKTWGCTLHSFVVMRVHRIEDDWLD